MEIIATHVTRTLQNVTNVVENFIDVRNVQIVFLFRMLLCPVFYFFYNCRNGIFAFAFDKVYR